MAGTDGRRESLAALQAIRSGCVIPRTRSRSRLIASSTNDISAR
jgi:hypothetical protein